MKRLSGEMVGHRFLGLILIGILALPAFGERPESSFKAGVRAEATSDYDAAYQAYKLAHDKKPSDPRYMSAYLRMRYYASAKHIQEGQALRDSGKSQEALNEFRLAAQMDPSNFAAFQEIRRTVDLQQKSATANDRSAREKAQGSYLEKAAEDAGGPVALVFHSDIPLTLHLATTADIIYRTIGKLAAINVLFDPDYKPQKVNFELQDVSVREALSMLALQSKTFWRPVSPNTIMVSSDNGGKRKELEQNVMVTFYLHNVATPAELQEAASTLKGILDINRIQVTPQQRSLTLRGTPDQMVLAQKLLGDIDKPKAEVMIEVAVLEVSRDRLRTLGVNPPTSATATLQPLGTTSSTGAAGSSGGLTLNSFASLTANNILISIPSASLSALMSDSNTKVIQKPELRAMDSEKATLKIGDRIPIATGSFQSGISNGVNTQFQYIDVGVNVDIIPYVHANHDVTLKMALEISSVTGEQTISGVTEPTIGQRRIEHQARLADGEVNLIGGILEDSESKSLSGYPLLTKIPILKYLFGQESRQRQQSEIVFAITPHIVRQNEVTDENQRMVDIGTSNAVSYRPDGKAGAAARSAMEKTPTNPVPQSAPASSSQSPTPLPPTSR